MTAADGQIALHVDGIKVATAAGALPTLTAGAQVGAPMAAAAAAPSGADPAAAPADPSASQAPAPADPAATPAPADAPAGAAPDAAAAAVPAASATTGFVGDIDELQIAKVARPAGFVRLAAIGQGPDHAKLITFSVDEETSSWLSGHFAVILKSVTLDGWVVIALCGVMAVISWVVMVEKVSYLNRASKGNTLFLKRFREAATDLDGLLRVDDEEEIALARDADKKETRLIEGAPLHRLFHLGADEIRNRFSGSGNGGRVLSPQAIAAIRAVLDSGYVRETQKLNRSIVMLTIAISGGPFLGLLGTVIGVMITFAAIAASGDVNINAIAPGIAAALVATVAGLGVAIPALFGYNYLVIRIKDTTSEMQVFIDEFVTKMAESFHGTPERPVKIAAE
jgi:biopolymer transport protein ExbB